MYRKGGGVCALVSNEVNVCTVQIRCFTSKIWTATESRLYIYSSPERQRPFIVEWQQTSRGLLQPTELCARPACHSAD